MLRQFLACFVLLVSFLQPAVGAARPFEQSLTGVAQDDGAIDSDGTRSLLQLGDIISGFLGSPEEAEEADEDYAETPTESPLAPTALAPVGTAPVAPVAVAPTAAPVVAPALAPVGVAPVALAPVVAPAPIAPIEAPVPIAPAPVVIAPAPVAPALAPLPVPVTAPPVRLPSLSCCT